jgi:hypothetical protein
MVMDMRSIIDKVASLAHMASSFIPAAGLVEQGVEIGGEIIDIIDGLHEHADPSQQAELQVARQKLSDAVKAHAASTSARLRG